MVPIAFAEDAEPQRVDAHPGARDRARRRSPTCPGAATVVTGVLYDALCADGFDAALLRAMTERHGGDAAQRGALAGSALAALRELPADAPPRAAR